MASQDSDLIHKERKAEKSLLKSIKVCETLWLIKKLISTEQRGNACSILSGIGSKLNDFNIVRSIRSNDMPFVYARYYE